MTEFYQISEKDITKVLRFVLDSDCDSFDIWVTDIRHGGITKISTRELIKLYDAITKEIESRGVTW
jgi:hypothetical protein